MVQWNVSEMGIDFDAWFTRLATQPLPGGVAAAAVAASMGSALVAKVSRLTLERRSLNGEDREVVESVAGMANHQSAILMGLALDDEQGYRAVLDTSRLPSVSPERRQAWQEATEIPLRLAEGCLGMLKGVPALSGICLPAARVDLRVGGWLLELGLRAGLEAAESNLSGWGDEVEALPFRSRFEKLRSGQLEWPAMNTS